MPMPMERISPRRPRRAQLHRRGRLFCLAILAATAGVKPVVAGYAFTTLFSFKNTDGSGADRNVMLDASGNLFGVTTGGGANGLGTVFELSGSGHQTFTTLISFNSSSGAHPAGGLTADSNGNLYGTTADGFGGYGSVYELTGATHQTLTTLANFSSSNGANPRGGVVFDSAGNLYGETSNGGANNEGIVFELSGANHTSLSTIETFNQPSTGAYPYQDLTIDQSGNLYGTVGYGFAGNNAGYGGVYELSGSNHQSQATLVVFNGTDGQNPEGGVVEDAAGNLYGTTSGGGTAGGGTIFEIQAGTQALITLHQFSGSDGTAPQATVVVDAAGDLFGTTLSGTVFEQTAAGNFNVLASGLGSIFSSLRLDSAGNIYGTTDNGGTNGDGSVFELSPAANPSTLSSFNGGSSWNTPTNWSPSGVPTSAINANFSTGGTYTVGFTAASSANDLHIAAGSPTFNLTGQSLTLSGGISVADAAGENANLTINGGTLTSGATSNSFRFGYSYIGDNQNSTGTMTLTNAANWTNNATNFDVGGSGSGTLTLQGTSAMTMTAGTLSVGDFAGGSGTVNIQGNSHATIGQLTIGNAGSGTLNVTGGGTLITTNAAIAADAGALPSVATITGTGSTWNNSGNLYVGGYSLIAGSQGVLNVSGGGSLNVAGTLKIWNSSNMVVNLTNGGTISVGNVDTTSNPVGLNWTGGTLSVTNSDVFIQAGSSFGASYTLNSGMALKLNSNTLWVAQDGTNTASLTVNAGAEIDAVGLQVAYGPPTYSSLTINGGAVNATNFTIGTHGFGGISVIAGGTFNTGTTYAGVYAGGFGQISVSGNGVWNDSGSLYLGGSNSTSGGTGILSIGPNGSVAIAGTLKAWNAYSTSIALQPGGSLSVGTLDTSGSPSLFNWTGGALNITNGLTIDNSSAAPFGNRFQLNNGQSLSANYESVGNNGDGSLTQNAGTVNTVAGNLTLGNQSSMGNYTLYGGNLSAGAILVNQGMLTQSGGNLSANAGAIMLGLIQQVNYTLSGGTASAATMQIGIFGNNSGMGDLVVNGGQLTITGALTVLNQDSSINLLGGGTINAGSIYLASLSHFNWNVGGTLNLTGSSLAIGNGGTLGSLNLQSGMTLNVSGGVSVITGSSFPVGGGSLITPTLTVPAGANYLQTGGVATLNSTAVSGGFNLAGGTISVAAITSFNNSSLALLTGGTFNSSTTNIGGAGLSVQGGTLLASNLNINSSLLVSAGSVTVSGSTTLANSSSFVLTNNGTFTTDILASTAGATLNLSGGTLNLTDPTTTVSVSYNGSIGSVLNIGHVAGSSVNYVNSLSVGATEYVGTSVTSISGMNSAANLLVDSDAIGPGSYALQGGMLTANVEQFGSITTGTITQSGGTNIAGTIELAVNAGSSGTVNLQSGLTNVSNGMYVGGSPAGPGGSGKLKVTGGQLNVSGGLVVYDTGSTLTVTSGNVSADSATLYSAGNTVGTSSTFNVGTGGLTFSGNDSPNLTLAAGAKLVLNGPLAFNGATGTASINGGTINLAGGTQTFNISRGTSAVDTTISASIINGSLLKTGTGILVLQGTNFITSGVEVGAGTIQISNPGALGVNTAETVDSGGTLDLNATNIAVGSLTLNGSGALGVGALINSNVSGSAISGPVILNSLTLIGGAGNISFGSAVSGSGGLTKIGPDSLTLQAANFSGGLSVTQGNLIINQPGTFSGNITLTGGTLTVNSDAALGSIYNALFLEGGSIDASANFSSSRTIVLAGGGLAVDTNQLLTLTGTLLGGSTLSKTGGGTLRLTSASSFGGPVVISSGTLSLAGASGALPYVTSVDVQTSGTLELNSAFSGNQTSQNRVNDSAPITLDGGTLALNGSSGAATNESLGVLIPSTGASTVIAINGSNGSNSYASNLTFASLGTRAPGATVDFEGNGNIFFAGGLADGQALGGWATVNGANFAKYSSTYGIIPFAPTDYTVNSFTPGANVKLIPSVTMPPVPGSVGTVSINSLNITADIAGVAVNQNPGTTLTLANGGLLKAGSYPATMSGGILNSSSGEINISVSGGPLTISSQLAGPFLLTERGSGTLTLSGSIANAYTGFTLISGNLNLSNPAYVPAIPGNLNISGGLVTSLADGQLSSNSNVIISGGGEWNLNGHTETIQTFSNLGGTMLFNHGLLTVLNQSNGTLLAGGTTTLGSTLISPLITITGGNNDVQGNNSSGTLVPGLMDATQALVFNSSNPAVTVEAGTAPNLAGQVVLGSTASLSFFGTGTAQMSTGTIGAFPGVLNLSGGTTHVFTVAANATLAISAQISNGAFTLSGSGGILKLSGSNDYDGGTTIGQGATLMALTKSALGGSDVPITFAGGTLALRSSLPVTAYPYSATVSGASVSSAIDLDVPVSGPGVGAGTFQLQAMTVGSNGSAFTLTGADGGTLTLLDQFTIESNGTPTTFLHTSASLNLSNGIKCVGGGLVNLIKDKSGTLTIAGNRPDSYGSLTVNGGTVLLQNNSGSYSAVPGDLLIYGGSTVRAVAGAAPNQIASTSNVTINSAGGGGTSLLDLNGNSDQLASLSFVGGGTLSTGSGTAMLGNNINASAGSLVSQIFGNINLSAANSTVFNIASGSTSTGIDMQIAANISGGSFTKLGPGLLYLSGANTFVGTVTVAAGFLRVDSLANLNNQPVNLAGGTLQFSQSLVAAPNTGLSLAAASISDLDTGTNTITESGAITGSGGLAKVGTGILVLNGTNSFTGVTNVSGGRLILASGASLASTSIQVGHGAFFAAVGSLPNANSSNFKLNINGAADLGTNLTLANLTALAAQGYAAGTWNGAAGVTSSQAAADTTHLTAVGIILNNQAGAPLYSASSLFHNYAPAAGDVLMALTYYGDVNLDGKVDASDYSRIDNGFTQHLTGWFNGDFNYDGVVNGSDYTLIDNAFNTQGAQLAAEIAVPTAELAGLPGTSVPEPGVLGLLAISTLASLSRRTGRRMVLPVGQQ